MHNSKVNTIRARAIFAPNDYELVEIPDAWISIGTSGDIREIRPYQPGRDRVDKECSDGNGLMTLLPGFCDLHFHWVQDLVCTQGKDSLLSWLDTYVFSEEARFESEVYSELRAEEFFQKLASSGTVAGSIYASIHQPSLDMAFRYAKGYFLCGNPVMTSHSPPSLRRTLDWFAKQITDTHHLYGNKLAITPRFALSCDPDTLNFLGKFSQENQLYVQTHLSETLEEINTTLEYYRSFPSCRDVVDYLDIYDRAGLLHDKTLLGHCIHLSDRELRRMAQARAVAVHCPTSNAPVSESGLGSGLMNYEKMDQHGVRWALATDIGAGPQISMLDVMQSFLRQHRKAGREPGIPRALFRATRAGFDTLNLPMGQLSPGQWASFALLPSSRQPAAKWVLEEFMELDRSAFADLVQATVFRGEFIFDRNA